MRAWCIVRPGGPEVLELETLPDPQLAPELKAMTMRSQPLERKIELGVYSISGFHIYSSQANCRRAWIR